MSTVLLLTSFLGMLALGFPVIFALGISALGYLLVNGMPIAVVSQVMVNYLTQFVLLAVPLFIFAAQLMNAGGMTGRIIALLRSIVGPIRGSLAHINVLASMIFAGVSGAAVADAASVGTIMIKAMDEEGYETEYSAAVSAASATVGPIIPPSVPMIIAGSMAGISVSSLFIGGLLPGLLMGLSMMTVVAIVAHRRQHPRHAFAGVRSVAKSLASSLLDLLLPGVIIGGIVFGFFTPTEGAGIAVLAALLLGGVIHRDLSLADVLECARQTILVTAEVLLIAAAAIAFGYVLTYERVPQTLIEVVATLDLAPWAVLLIINAVLLVLGALIAGMATLLIAIPVLMPLVPVLGIDPNHFVVMLVLATMLGTVTPPVGVTLFIVSSVSNTPIGPIVKELLPFLAANIVVLLLVAYLPPLTLYLPRLFAGQ